MTHPDPRNSRYILILGGTGMLCPAVEELLRRDLNVLVVSRRPHRRGPAKPGHATSERAQCLRIVGDWREPEVLGEQVLQMLDQQGVSASELGGAIVWVHSPYRQAVLDQLEHLLVPGATVLQLWGSALHNPREILEQDNITPRPWKARHLLLGYFRKHGISRWLTDEEISQATIKAWEDHSSQTGIYTAGHIEPWDQHP